MAVRGERRRGRVGVVVGVVGIAAVLGVGGVAVVRAAQPAPAVSEALVFDVRAPRLAVEVESGDVTVGRADGDQVQVRRTVRARGAEPRLEETSTADGVRLDAECPWTFGSSCSVDYDVRVPDGLTVEVRTSSGAVALTGLAAQAVDVRVSSGDVRLADVRGAVVVEASSGEVSGERLEATSFSATTSSGSVVVDFARPPADVEIEASSGDVDVALPGGPYRVEAEASSGDERVSVPVDDAAPGAVRVGASSGDVTVRAR